MDVNHHHHHQARGIEETLLFPLHQGTGVLMQPGLTRWRPAWFCARSRYI
jgi:hypothetical protein